MRFQGGGITEELDLLRDPRRNAPGDGPRRPINFAIRPSRRSSTGPVDKRSEWRYYPPWDWDRGGPMTT